MKPSATEKLQLPTMPAPPGKPGQVIEFSLTRGERRVLKKRRKLPPSVWAERYRVLTMSSLPGPWKNATAPYLAGIMDASFHPSVRMVIVVASPQSGKTESLYNCIGYAADCDPGPTIVLMPDELMARGNCNDRIQPMFTSSHRLSRYLSENPNDMSSLKINLRHMPIYMAWARSVAQLSNRPCRYAMADEVDKYPVFVSARESGPVDLLKKRQITYRRTSKLWMSSTPTIEDGPIWIALLTEAQVIFDFLPACAQCNHEQVMRFENIHWGDSRDPEEIEHRLMAYYECSHCGAKWDDLGRDSAVRRGCWRARITTPATARELALTPHKAEHGEELSEYLRKYNPAKIGFHVPSQISPFVTLSQNAAAFCAGRKTRRSCAIGETLTRLCRGFTTSRSAKRIPSLR